MPLLLLGFFVLTSASVNAQSFKSVDDASLAVKEALQELLPLSSNPQTLELKQKAANARIFNLFTTEISNATDTESAYNALQVKLDALNANATLNSKNSKEKALLFDNALDALLEVITE